MSNSILFMAREFTVGGAAYLALRHLRHIAASQPIDFLVSGAVCPTMAAALPPTVALEQLDLRTEVVEQGLWATREALASTGHPFLEREYAAVLGTSLFPDLAACAAFSMSRSRRKVLILLDEGPLHAPRSSEHRAAIRGAMLSADHIVSVSQALLDKLGTEYPLLHDLPATILPPPIDAVATVEPPSPFAITGVTMAGDAHLPHVVTVARLSAEKCVNTCLQVHRSLRDVGLDFHWHVVGEGQERQNLEREIARRRMSDRFHLEGFQPDVSPWMRHADLFVLLSSAEGCPTVIREALAAGTPVLCTDVSGARELIDQGVTGIVVSHHFPEISAALKRLLQNPAERARLRQNITSRKSTPQSCSVRHESERLLELLSGDPRSRPPAVVTILIPTYNHERSIGSAIQSALMQDYPALEVVVCDDASTDATDVAARRWSHDPRLRIRRHATNQGRVANYRLGLEREATGTWVLMLDGDDHLVDPTFITQALAALAEHSSHQPLFVQAGHRVVWRTQPGDSRRVFGPVDLLPAISAQSSVMPGAAYLQFVYATGFFTHLGTLYSRSAALRQGFYTNNISSSDLDSLLRLALTGNVVVLKTIAGCWVQHGSNASFNLPLDRIEENVCIFRQIALEGAAAGVIDMHRIERYLTRYEARTLAYLFGTTIGKSSQNISHAWEMIRIMLRVNPRICFQPHFIYAWCRAVKQLSWHTLRRWLRKIKPQLLALRNRLP